MNNIFALCHQSDIDGVGSAALIKIRYGIPLRNIFFTDYSLDNMLLSKKRICSTAKRGAVLIIADLGLNKATKKPFSEMIDYIHRIDGKVYWFDHHVWDADGIKRIASKCDAAIVNENKKYCATEIVRNELGLNSSFCAEFAEIVHYSDFNLLSDDKRHRRMIIEYAMAMTSYQQIKDYSRRNNKLRRIAGMISNGRFSDSRMKKDAETFDKVNKERIRRMLGRLIVLDDVAVGFQRGIQSTLACAAVGDKGGKDIGVYINLDNMHGHIRTKEADCQPLAAYFGGGGHPHASGFSLNEHYDFSKSSERMRFALLVQKKAKELCG